MAEPLSVDLRKRVVDAVKGGMCRPRAAGALSGCRFERHPVGAASRDDPFGFGCEAGHYAGGIAGGRGGETSLVRRLGDLAVFARRRITLKKSPRTPGSRNGRTS